MNSEVSECSCPICRFARKEISFDAIAWYLKGSIEHQSRYLKLIQEAKTLDELKESVKMDSYDLDCNYDFLNDLKNNEKMNPEKHWDPAFDQPEKYKY